MIVQHILIVQTHCIKQCSCNSKIMFVEMKLGKIAAYKKHKVEFSRQVTGINRTPHIGTRAVLPTWSVLHMRATLHRRSLLHFFNNHLWHYLVHSDQQNTRAIWPSVSQSVPQMCLSGFCSADNRQSLVILFIYFGYFHCFILLSLKGCIIMHIIPLSL